MSERAVREWLQTTRPPRHCGGRQHPTAVTRRQESAPAQAILCGVRCILSTVTLCRNYFTALTQGILTLVAGELSLMFSCHF